MSFFFSFIGDKKFQGDPEKNWIGLKPVYMNGPGYGGLIGTTRGLSKFLKDMMREKPILFGAETKRLFFTLQKNSSGAEIETTMGWHRGNLNGVSYFGKPGGGPGFNSNVRIYPAKGVASVWLINCMNALSESPINEFSDRIDREFIKGR